MAHGSRIVAVIVLVAVGAVFGSIQASASFVPDSNLPPCHGQMPTLPSPAPVHYQCCIDGHHSAIPQAAFSVRPLVGKLSVSAPIDVNPGSSTATYSLAPVFVANSPPAAAPFRI